MPLLVFGPPLLMPMELIEPSSRVSTSRPLYFFFHFSGYGGQPSTGGGTSALNRPVFRASAFDMPATAGPTRPGSMTSSAGAGTGFVGAAVGSGVALGSGDGEETVFSGSFGSSDPQPLRTRRAATAATSVRFIMGRSCRTGEAVRVGTER